ncbi:MAG: hypothetical protein H7226_05850 [Salinibacterium sp.]|nr:hypothetical protein [Salinibacterium sp.]
MTVATKEVHRPLAVLLPLSLVAVVTILGITAIWILAVPHGPEVCALSMPGPRNCFVADRASAARSATAAIALLGAAIMLTAVFSARSRRAIAFVGPIVLLIAAVAAYLSAAWIPAWAFPWVTSAFPSVT